MSTDRRIGLEIGLSQGGAEWDARQGGDAERRRDADEADSQAFARALKGADGESLDAARMSAPLTPFGLFGPAPPQAPAAPDAASGLEESLRLAAGRLLVSDQGGGGRREVRVELDEGFMEGVSVSVFEDGGALAVLFAARASARSGACPRWRRAWPMAWPPACGGWSGSICRTATAPTSIPASGWRMVRLPERPWMPSP